MRWHGQRLKAVHMVSWCPCTSRGAALVVDRSEEDINIHQKTHIPLNTSRAYHHPRLTAYTHTPRKNVKHGVPRFARREGTALTPGLD